MNQAINGLPVTYFQKNFYNSKMDFSKFNFFFKHQNFKNTTSLESHSSLYSLNRRTIKNMKEKDLFSIKYYISEKVKNLENLCKEKAARSL